MALMAGQIPVSGYQTPDYSGAAQAAGAVGAQIPDMVSGFIAEYKDLAKKDKEISSKIKATISLLDNAKGIYADFAPEIENMKSQLSDPSISNLDKSALAEQVAGSLNMFAQYGTEGMKNKLIEAQIAQANAQATQAKAQMEAAGRTPTTGVVNGKVVEGFGDLKTGEFTPFTTGGQASTRYRSTAFGRSTIDPTTAAEQRSGQFKKMGGDENVGSGGIRYAGPSSKTPTIATKAYPAGTRLMIKSDLYPEGREHLVAGTGPADPNVLDFFADNKEEYNKLAAQRIYDVQVLDGKTKAISDAVGMRKPTSEPGVLGRAIQGIMDIFNPNEPPANQAQVPPPEAGISNYVEAVPKGDSFRPATKEEAAAQNALSGQINTRTGRFYEGGTQTLAKTPTTPKKTASDVSFEQNSKAALRYADELIATLNKYGTFEIYDSKGAAKLGQLPYQMAIAYAKTVDPSSVAREGEVDAAKKYLIPTGISTRKETALAAAEEFKKDIEARIKEYNATVGVGAEATGSNVEVSETNTSPGEKEINNINTFFNQLPLTPPKP